MSVIVLDALKALGPRPALREREMVAAALRTSGDTECSLHSAWAPRYTSARRGSG